MRPLLALALLLLVGAARLTIETHIESDLRAANFHRLPLQRNVREQIGQSGFIAALGGFRSLVADFLWIEAHTAWEKTEWSRMRLLFDTIHTLQPRSIVFWDMAAWHMAYNASVAVSKDPTIRLEAMRRKLQREYFDLGRSMLVRGIAYNPDRYELYEKLGLLLRDKLDDHPGASAAFASGAAQARAPSYLKRFAAYEMAKIPGREAEAHRELLRLYRLGEQEHLPTLLALLRKLQTTLPIPPADRIPPDPSRLRLPGP